MSGGRNVVALLAGWFVASSSAWGQVGALVATPEQYQAVPEWQAPALGVGETYRVDLRPLLPPVANQGRLNSCTGWAIGYAARSYQEVIDQGWRANASSRQFSPLFIYNQINGGQDRGASMLRALDLVARAGCATLATAPNQSDHTARPSAEAVREAGQFRISGYSRLSRGWQIRHALMLGQPVVVALRTDPLFVSGRFTLFTADLRRQGDRLRQPNQPHAYHAMCVVGYDDSRQAYLLLNSWGTQWCQQGFCWIAYDLCQTIQPNPENLVQEAYVMHDIRNRLNQPAPPDRPVVDRNVLPQGQAWYAGVQQGMPVWRGFVSITGSPAAMASVKEVRWNLPDGRGGTVVFRASDGASGFRAGFLQIRPGQVEVAGTVVFRDNAAVAVAQRFQFNAVAPQRRDIRMAQSDRYLGRPAGGKPTWEWTVHLTGSAIDLGDVEQVTYHLHPTFRPPDRTVTESPANGFAYTTSGWGTFPVKATVRFKDSTSVQLEVALQFTDPPREELTLTNVARYTGQIVNNVGIYDWTAYLEGPLARLRQIRKVTYQLHRTFPNPVVEIADGADRGFAVSARGWGVFTLRADVLFQDGTTTQLSHKLKFTDNDRDANAPLPVPDKDGGYRPIPDKDPGPLPVPDKDSIRPPYVPDKDRGLAPVPDKDLIR